MCSSLSRHTNPIRPRYRTLYLLHGRSDDPTARAPSIRSRP